MLERVFSAGGKLKAGSLGFAPFYKMASGGFQVPHYRNNRKQNRREQQHQPEQQSKKEHKAQEGNQNGFHLIFSLVSE